MIAPHTDIAAIAKDGMNKKKPHAPKYQVWVDARKRHNLSHAQVQMARELGLNPKKLGNIDNHDEEPWKVPLSRFIEELHRKRFGKDGLFDQAC